MTLNHKLSLVFVLTMLGPTVAPREWVEAATAQGDYWIGTWAAAAQPSLPRATQTFRRDGEVEWHTTRFSPSVSARY